MQYRNVHKSVRHEIYICNDTAVVGLTVNKNKEILIVTLYF